MKCWRAARSLPGCDDMGCAKANGVASSPVVAGVGADAPMVENERGGKHSLVPYRCDLLPPLAVLEIAAVLHRGASSHGEENWRKVSVRDHLNHAMTHVLAHFAGDASDGHLSHAACRLLFALELQTKGEFVHGS